MTRKPQAGLRRGWTTGACATAATKAAYGALLTGRFADPVEIDLPRGERPSFVLAEKALLNSSALASVCKDAGDDPDVTHGALIRVTVRRIERGTGVLFVAGEGVGVVTRPGLPVPVGEPAINPSPRTMMRQVIQDLAAQYGDSGDVEVVVSIPGGAELARRTANGRLGIVGGLSVLGTTGVVVPYSCAAWIHAIHRGVDVARAAGTVHVAACTGSTSERGVRRILKLPDHALIDMGDFVGGMLKYLRRHPVPRLTIAGGFAKLAKLAAGHLDLHSSRSRVDFDLLGAMAETRGASASSFRAIVDANTALDALVQATYAGVPLADDVAARARQVVLDHLQGDIEVDVMVFDREARLVGRTDAGAKGRTH